MSKKLAERVVIVTGAAQGMGRAIAIEAARQGAAFVTIADINAGQGEEAAAVVRAEGAEARFLQTDLRDSAAIRATIEETVRLGGGLDVLINNAGVTDDRAMRSHPSIESLTGEAWDTVLGINLKAMWLAAKFAAPYLRRSKRAPAIVNAASVASTVGYPGLPAYGASKAGVVLLTQTIAIDLARDGIRCNAYAPGAIDTPMLAHSFEMATDREAAASRMWGAHLIKRLGGPEEVAKFVCFLASDEASFCTGGTYRVDGGTLAWRGVG